MKRNFLPNYVGISMTKSQFSFCTGINPYQLRKHLSANESRYSRLGYHRWDKLLMPSIIMQLCADLGVSVDVNLYAQYVAGQRGIPSPVIAG